MKPILQASNLKKVFNNNGAQHVVIPDLSFSLYEGDFTVIMGPSGSGKSTLLYLLSALDKPTAGDVIFQGQSLARAKETQLAKIRQQQMGFVFQSVNLISHLTLFQNILASGYLTKTNSRQVRQRARELLAQVGLAKEGDKLPSQVSGGQAQRGAIVRAIINQPAVLFADEPTGALNQKYSQEILELLFELNQSQNKTIVMVTHDMKVALYGSRVLYLCDGEIVGDLKLGVLEPDKLAERQATLLSFLKDKGW